MFFKRNGRLHKTFIILILYFTLTVLCKFSEALIPQIDKFSIHMPNVKPETAEAYLCTPVSVDPSEPYFIVGFNPNASMNVAHHMLLYGCESPGSTEDVWDCGGMQSSNYSRAGTCAGGSHIIYAWARNAPHLNLPDGVAFRVGGDTKINYLVLQVHYADISSFTNGKTDSSGVELIYTKAPQPKSAGVYLLGTGGYIPAQSTEHMETSCRYREDKVMHPFAYRTHTHSLGRVVSGYRVRRNYTTGKDEWSLIGKKNPLLPEMFYPVENKVPVSKEDILAARCTMVSNRTRITTIGATAEDEMCNFYIMYWTDGSESLSKNDCFSSGPPYYYWSNGEPSLNNIPDLEASTL